MIRTNLLSRGGAGAGQRPRKRSLPERMHLQMAIWRRLPALAAILLMNRAAPADEEICNPAEEILSRPTATGFLVTDVP